MIHAKELFRITLATVWSATQVKKLTAGILGAMAVAASIVVLRSPRPAQANEIDQRTVPAGEKVPGQISLDRLRELGY
jgi:hypothetical protein